MEKDGEGRKNFEDEINNFGFEAKMRRFVSPRTFALKKMHGINKIKETMNDQSYTGKSDSAKSIAAATCDVITRFAGIA
jgi:hypothetical protein